MCSFFFIFETKIKGIKKKSTLFFTILLVSVFSFGQDEEHNAWNATFFDFSLSSSQTIRPDYIRLELHNRTKSFYNINDQILIRPAYNLKVNEYSNISIGYTYISTNQNQGRINENNFWQQYNFSFPVNKLKYFGWVRLEQRWIKKPITSDNKFYSLKYSNDYNTRIRFRAGFEFILVDNVTRNLNFIVFNEVFMILKNVYPYNFNQNWTFFGFKKRLNTKAVLISGFQRNSIFRGGDYLHKNIWSSILFYKI